jgi:single-stranded-DNA-specific exonuclease
MPDWVWRLAEPLADGAAPELAEWPQPLRQLLFNRGLRTREEVEEFLHPERAGLHDPNLLLGMEIAVGRIYRALRNEELIAIYGDFDVDGITAVALLMEVLESPVLEGRVVGHLPHRTKDGYGLHLDSIRGLAEKGARLLITVDCGIGADEQIRYANSLGMDVIVTDHHLISDGVPPALAVLNARQDGCSYPFKELSGVAMAYKLAEALLANLWGLEAARERVRPQLDLVALGVVADVAPLTGENRLLVKLGLKQINSGARPGLRALTRSAGFGDRVLDAETISYTLAPRLNAAGRMGDARLSLDLLRVESESEAERMAMQLEEANRWRQSATAAALSAAREELRQLPELPPAIVLAGDYPAGIVGLVAGRLAEEFWRPAFIIELGETESRGSGRGIPGFDVVQALSGASDLLLRFGGHTQAGGFALPTSELAPLRERLEAAAVEQLGTAAARPELQLDAQLRLSAVGPILHRYLTLLEPYGAGNIRPLFCSQKLLVRDVRVVGNGHLKLWLSDQTGVCPAIGFGMGAGNKDFVRPGTLVDCAYAISRNDRGGTVGYEMVLKDLRPWSASPSLP